MACEPLDPPDGEEGFLGNGRFLVLCEDQVSVCDDLFDVAVGAEDISIIFNSYSSYIHAVVVPVSSNIFEKPLMSAFVALDDNRVVDFVNLASRIPDGVRLEGIPISSNDNDFEPWEKEFHWVQEELSVGCLSRDWDPDRLYLVPVSSEGIPLHGVLPWEVEVDPPIAEVYTDGNRLAIKPPTGSDPPVSATLTVSLPDQGVQRDFPLMICSSDWKPPPEDVLEVMEEDVIEVFEEGETVDHDVSGDGPWHDTADSLDQGQAAGDAGGDADGGADWDIGVDIHDNGPTDTDIVPDCQDAVQDVQMDDAAYDFPGRAS